MSKLNTVKEFSDYSFSELIDLSKEQFDLVLSRDDSNVGYLENLRKLLSAHYDGVKVQIDALSELHNNKDTDEVTKQKCIETIKGMYKILFSIEYKACAIYEKVKRLTEQID